MRREEHIEAAKDREVIVQFANTCNLGWLSMATTVRLHRET